MLNNLCQFFISAAMATTTNPEDLRVAYAPDIVTMNDNTNPVEIRGGGIGELSGSADSYYEDFTTGARQAARAFAEHVGGSAWFDGGGTTDGIVLGVDWLASLRHDAPSEDETPSDPDEAAGDVLSALRPKGGVPAAPRPKDETADVLSALRPENDASASQPKDETADVLSALRPENDVLTSLTR